MVGAAPSSGSQMSASPNSPPTLYGIDLGIPLHTRRVLIADDSAFSRRTLTRFLTWAGIHQVDYANTGEEVEPKVEEFNPDLIVLDTTPPRMDGIEICRLLRKKPHYRDLPILMQSAVNSDQHRTICFQAGATDIITKPVNPGECIARVRYHLERRSLVQELRDFRERVERDLRMARAMQLALVPDVEQVAASAARRNLYLDAEFITSDEVGGDFWSMFELDDHRTGIFVSDLSGHGITAAINAFRLHTLIARMPQESKLNPGLLLGQLNVDLVEILALGQYATAIYGVLDTENDTFTFSSACAPNPILGIDGQVEAVDASGVYLGAFSGETYDNTSISVPPGSFLFFYSDAITESMDESGEMLGEDGLMGMVRDVIADRHTAESPLRVLLDRFRRIYGDSPHDDLTAVWIARR